MSKKIDKKLKELKNLDPKTRSVEGQFLNKIVTKPDGSIAKIIATPVDLQKITENMLESTKKGKVSKVEDIKRTDAPKIKQAKKPTKKQVDKAKELISKAKKECDEKAFRKREAINHLGSISIEANQQQHDFMSDMLCLGLRKYMGNAKLNKEMKQIEKQRSELYLKQNQIKAAICDSDLYRRAKKKLLKKFEKQLKKMYKKAKKKYGKKTAKFLFSNSTCDFTALYNFKEPVSKKLKQINLELEAKNAEIEADARAVQSEITNCLEECPKVAPEDLSIRDNSFIHGKRRVELPGDGMNINADNIDIRDVLEEEEDLETMDLDELDRNAP